MTRLAPAVLELRIVAASTIAIGCARAGGLLAVGDSSDLRGFGLGLSVCVLAVWGLWGARAVRTAIRLALPVRPRWALEGLGATALRVSLAQVVPICVIALVGSSVAASQVDGAAGIGAGALVGVGLTALMAAQRVRRGELHLARRLLREPRRGAPLGRSSLFLEPQALFERPSGPVAAPWPAHRPPPRAQRSAIELDPANASARHPVGVRTRPRVPVAPAEGLSPPAAAHRPGRDA